jgi:hypothetical protein
VQTLRWGAVTHSPPGTASCQAPHQARQAQSARWPALGLVSQPHPSGIVSHPCALTNRQRARRSLPRGVQVPHLAVYLMSESKKGISAKQVQRMLGVSYKTAWYLCHRIRDAMGEDNSHSCAGSSRSTRRCSAASARATATAIAATRRRLPERSDAAARFVCGSCRTREGARWKASSRDGSMRTLRSTPTSWRPMTGSPARDTRRSSTSPRNGCAARSTRTRSNQRGAS